jgi:hypothetical protein
MAAVLGGLGWGQCVCGAHVGDRRASVSVRVEYLPLSGLVGSPRNPKEQLGRRGHGLEIEPMSVAVALEGLASMGLKPEVVS